MKSKIHELKNTIKNSVSKKIITTAFILCAVTSSAFAQNSSKLASLPYAYYNIKNALVKSDASATSTAAADFSRAVKSVDMDALSSTEMNAFMPLQNKLAAEADKIAASKNLQTQRDNFAALSADFYTLLKSVKLSEQPIYQAYCPMKKAYWLSSDKVIKNPYFGNAMLSCGSIKDTIQ